VERSEGNFANNGSGQGATGKHRNGVEQTKTAEGKKKGVFASNKSGGRRKERSLRWDDSHCGQTKIAMVDGKGGLIEMGRRGREGEGGTWLQVSQRIKRETMEGRHRKSRGFVLGTTWE